MLYPTIYSTPILWAGTVCWHYSMYWGYSSDWYRQSSTSLGKLNGHNKLTFKHIIWAEVTDLERKKSEQDMERQRLGFYFR